MDPIYTVRKTEVRPEGQAHWDGPVWSKAETAAVNCFRPEGSSHRPATAVRLLYDDDALFGLFRVEDRYVRCVHTAYQEQVCKDSCVECFIQPRPDRGYLNFEMNAGGNLLLYHVIDPTRVPSLGLRKVEKIPADWGAKVRRFATLPASIEPEIEDPVEWHLEFAVPWTLFARTMDVSPPSCGEEWRVNFFKCGDETSHPHWVSWAPLSAKNFHLPECFGTLRFA